MKTGVAFYRASKRWTAVGTVAAGAFAALAIWVVDFERGDLVFGLILSLAIFAALMWRLLTTCGDITVDTEGFTYSNFGRVWRFAWLDVSEFKLEKDGDSWALLFSRLRTPPERESWLKRELGKMSVFVPSSANPEELVSQFNELRSQARDTLARDETA